MQLVNLEKYRSQMLINAINKLGEIQSINFEKCNSLILRNTVDKLWEIQLEKEETKIFNFYWLLMYKLREIHLINLEK